MVHLARQRLSDAVERLYGRKEFKWSLYCKQLVLEFIGHFSEEAPPGKVYAILIEDFDSKGKQRIFDGYFALQSRGRLLQCI